MNANDHYRNRTKYPPEKLLPLAGKYVAWSEDGNDILAAAEEIPDLIAAVDAQYPVGTEFVISRIPAVGCNGSRPIGVGMAPVQSVDGVAS